jgi:recombination protein RecR
MKQVLTKEIQNAVEHLSSLPGIGRKSALRLALHLLKKDSSEIEMFAQAIVEMKRETSYCVSCGNISSNDLCVICSDEKRDKSVLCVVEDVRDIMAIENTEQYKGVYHVLNGVISPMDGIGPQDLNIEPLVDKVESGKANEVILALSSTMEGDTTNFYLYKKLSKFHETKITTLSKGVSVGSELQYADSLSLGKSILNRTLFEQSIQNS